MGVVVCLWLSGHVGGGCRDLVVYSVRVGQSAPLLREGTMNQLVSDLMRFIDRNFKNVP